MDYNFNRFFHLFHSEPRDRFWPMTGQGSAGNVIAALCSFFIPGLGQLLQGRPIAALFQFCISGLLWVIWLGWIGHIWSALNAAWYKPKA